MGIELPQLRARWFAIAYLLAIPLFAIYYFVHSSEFVYANTRFEPWFEVAEKKVLALITEEVQAAVLRDRPPTSSRLECHVLATGISFDRFSVADQEIVFEVSYDVGCGGKPFYQRLVLKLGMLSLRKVTFAAADGATVERSVHYIKAVEGMFPDADTPFQATPFQRITTARVAQELFPQPIIEGTKNGPRVLLLEPYTSHLLLQLVRAWQGNESAWESPRARFSRMLYLSMITIATVGYGDIAPTSPATRTATAAEAFSGVLLAGLYMNALARGRRSPDSKATQANGD